MSRRSLDLSGRACKPRSRTWSVFHTVEFTSDSIVVELVVAMILYSRECRETRPFDLLEPLLVSGRFVRTILQWRYHHKTWHAVTSIYHTENKYEIEQMNDTTIAISSAVQRRSIRWASRPTLCRLTRPVVSFIYRQTVFAIALI